MKRRIIIIWLLSWGIIPNFLFGYFDGFQKKEEADWKKLVKEFPPSPEAKELALQYFFPAFNPNDTDNYLWDPRQFLVDNNGDIFIIDNKWKCIFKLDSKGRIIKKKGRLGQGPGEFQNPFCFCMNSKFLFVSDTNKYEIQVFDKGLNFIRSFKVRKAYLSIAVNKHGLLLACPLRTSRDARLVDVLDDSGKLLYSFAEGLYGNERNWNVHNFVYIDANNKDEIFLAYWHYPTVCKYDIKGNLLARYEINNNFLNYAKKLNNDRLSDPTNRIFTRGIWGIHAKEGGFYILLNRPYTRILEFNENGKQIAEFWTVRSYDYEAQDLSVKIDSVLILSRAPNAVVEVFRAKYP